MSGHEFLIKSIETLICLFLQETSGMSDVERVEFARKWSVEKVNIQVSLQEIEKKRADQRREISDSARCQGTTLNGTQCRNRYSVERIVDGNEQKFCKRHDPSAKQMSRTRAVMTADPCKYVILRGPKKNQLCGKNTPEGSDYCSSHARSKVAQRGEISGSSMVLRSVATRSETETYTVNDTAEYSGNDVTLDINF